jgi:hypothetical protein
MTMQDVPLPIAYEWGTQYALLFASSLAARLAELHALHGQPDCLAVPMPTIDGRWFLTADILTATEPGGYLHAMWAAADKSILLPAVEVVPLAEALALLPGE